jgi:hypothetical protein
MVSEALQTLKIHRGVPRPPGVSNSGAPISELPKYLVGMLYHLVGIWLHHMNCAELLHTPGSLWVGFKDMIISFSVVLMFTRVLIREALNLLS